jgi:hypothetical protein
MIKLQEKLQTTDEHKSVYKNTIPDYLRVSEFYLDKRNVKHPERIAVLDKNNGWMTVDSQTLDKRMAFEKH